MESWLQPRVGWALVAALYLLSFPYHPGLRSPNELSRLWLSRAIVDHQTLSLNATIAESGMVGDLSRMDGPAGRTLYSSKAPLMSFLGAPVYWALKQVRAPVTELGQVFFSRLFLTVLPSLWLLWLLRRYLRATVHADVADLLTVTYALGTMAFSYSLAFMSHQATAVLLFTSFYCAWQVERGAWGERGYLLAGAAAGATVMAEYTGALGVLAIAVYVVASRWKQWGRLANAVVLVLVGSAPFLLGLMAYHQACFGHPLESGYKHLNDPGYQGWHVGGFLGIRFPDPRAFVLSFFSPMRGLFALSPVLLLGLWGLFDVKRRDPAQFAGLVFLWLSTAYFTSSFAYESWGWTVGPRHMTGVVPFLLLPIGLWLSRMKAQGKTLAFSVGAGLCVSSVLVVSTIVFVNYVPDDVSTSLWGLAVPLLSQGVLPVSWLSVWGVTNPASGLLLVGLAAGAAVSVGARFRAQGAAAVAMVVVVALHLGALKLAPAKPDHDAGAQRFLTSVWLGKNGSRFEFFP